MTAPPVASDYPWYALVEGSDLLQGDFLDQCPILIPPDDFQIPVLGEPTEIRVELRTSDVVVMSQSCDLEQEKLDLVLVYLHWSLERLADENDFFKSLAGKEQLGRGKRLRLLLPYREHLSQAFARFFMRVGLPVNIPPFRK